MAQNEITNTHVVIVPQRDGPSWLAHLARRTALVIRDKFWLVLLFTVTSAAAAFVHNETRTPLYRAAALVRPVSGNQASDFSREFDGLSLYASHRMGERIAAALSSPRILKALEQDPEILAALKSEGGDTKGFSSDERLRNAIIVKPDTSGVYALEVTDANPALARAVANALPALHNASLEKNGPSADLPYEAFFSQALARLKRDRMSAGARLEGKWRDDIPPSRVSVGTQENPAPSLDATLSAEPTPSAPLSDAALSPTGPSPADAEAIRAELREIRNTRVSLNNKIAVLETVLRNPEKAGSVALPEAGLKAAYQAIVMSKVKLDGLLKNYQVPEADQKKFRNDIALKTVNFNRKLKQSLATAQARLKELANREMVLNGSLSAESSFAKMPEPAPVPAPIIKAPSQPETLPVAETKNELLPLTAPAANSETQLPTKKTVAAVFSPVQAVPTPAATVPVEASAAPPSAPVTVEVPAFLGAEAMAALLDSLKSGDFPLPESVGPLHVVRPASLPEEPSSPDKAGNMAKAAGAGFLLGCLVAAAVGFRDEKIASPDDIEGEFRVPVLALVPQLKD